MSTDDGDVLSPPMNERRATTGAYSEAALADYRRAVKVDELTTMVIEQQRLTRELEHLRGWITAIFGAEVVAWSAVLYLLLHAHE